jgi:hypothetical protein
VLLESLSEAIVVSWRLLRNHRNNTKDVK